MKNMTSGGVKNNKTSVEFLEGPEPKTRVVEQCTKVRFARFLSGGFTTKYGSNKSTGKETGKTHLCGLSRNFVSLRAFNIVNG